MSNEKIFENIMNQFYLDKDEDINNGTNSKKGNNTSNHKNVSSMTNESDEDTDKNYQICITRRKKKIQKKINLLFMILTMKMSKNQMKMKINYNKIIEIILITIYMKILLKKKMKMKMMIQLKITNILRIQMKKTMEQIPLDQNKNKSHQNSLIKNFQFTIMVQIQTLIIKKNNANNSFNNMNNFTETIKNKIEGDFSLKTQ